MNIESKCLSINEVAYEAHKNAIQHGFYDDYMELANELKSSESAVAMKAAERDFILAQLAKICSEVGECVEVVQKKVDYDGLAEELSDIVIRTMDLAAFIGYDIGTHIALKMKKNESRPYKHGKLC